jgi:hypothetical protein
LLNKLKIKNEQKNTQCSNAPQAASNIKAAGGVFHKKMEINKKEHSFATLSPLKPPNQLNPGVTLRSSSPGPHPQRTSRYL